MYIFNIAFTVIIFLIALAKAQREIQWGVLSGRDVTRMGPFELTQGWHELRVEYISGRQIPTAENAQRKSKRNCARSESIGFNDLLLLTPSLEYSDSENRTYRCPGSSMDGGEFSRGRYIPTSQYCPPTHALRRSVDRVGLLGSGYAPGYAPGSCRSAIGCGCAMDDQAFS